MLHKWIIGGALVFTAGLASAQPAVQPTQPVAPTVPKTGTTAVTPPTVAAVDAKVLGQVDELLNAFETIPSEVEWKTLGPTAGVALRRVAVDKTTVVTRRKRAISALIYFPDDATKTLLKGIVTNAAESYRVRGQAAFSLALTSGEAAIADLTPLLSAEKHRLREATIKAFARIDSDAVVAPLKARLTIEPKAYLKEAIQKVLSERLAKKAAPAPAPAGDK